MSKGLIAFIVVACLALASLLYVKMRVSAAKAKIKSDEILRDFMTVDKDLKDNSYKIVSLNKELLNATKDTAHATGR